MTASVPVKGTVLLCDNKRQERELFPTLGNNVGSCSGSAKDLTAHLKRTAVEQGQTIGHKDTWIQGYMDRQWDTPFTGCQIQINCRFVYSKRNHRCPHPRTEFLLHA